MARTEHVIEPGQLMAYLDGELRPDRAMTTSAHLEHCRQCQAIAADLQSVSRQMMAWQVEVSGRRSLADLNAALEKSQQNSAEHTRMWLTTRRVHPWILGFAGTGACVIALLTLETPKLRQARLPVDMVRTRPVSAMLSGPVRVSTMGQFLGWPSILSASLRMEEIAAGHGAMNSSPGPVSVARLDDEPFLVGG